MRAELRQQLGESHGVSRPDDHAGISIPGVNLPHEFAAPSARGAGDPARAHRDHESNLGLTGLEHFGDRSMLCAEPHSTLRINANARVDASRARLDGCGHPPATQSWLVRNSPTRAVAAASNSVSVISLYRRCLM